MLHQKKPETFYECHLCVFDLQSFKVKCSLVWKKQKEEFFI